MTLQRSHAPDALRVGLFFDGTGNHAANAPFDDVVPAGMDGSHASALTNVHKLYQLYGGPVGTLAIYVPGIGTDAGEADSLLGSALGRGRTGVLARVEYAMAQLRQAMGASGSKAEVTVDLFGFSRGATAARHCVNQLRSLPGVRVGFVGLFDTVAAVAGARKVDLALDPAHVPQVVHLVARDEYRRNFALAQVHLSHTEIELPGAHADIGGGYLGQMREQVLVWPMQALTVVKGTKVETTSIYRAAEQERQLWLARGWPAHWLTVLTPAPTLVVDRTQVPQQQVYAALQLERDVRGELSRVYLRVMHGLALAQGVPMRPVPATGDCAVPAELEPLCQRFLQGDYRVSPEEDLRLRLGYIHVSAHWTPPEGVRGNQPRLGSRLLYINAPAADGVRERYRC
ncbi:DUF2235 domain-containing protein [Pseudomonas sp.]|uniref:phospholipase effector Tle1 domain-containing protein n=1 Tax=Pseudomonas sp. TaxID=306 RepID=UPI00258A88B6|nr:DUF2235 domain-containing protein [Pseudomonas sp.]